MSTKRRNVLAALIVAVCCLTSSALLSADANKICGFTTNNNNAPTGCQNCTCGCTPPACTPAAASGSKTFTGMYKCVTAPEQTCTFQRQDQTCATRFGWSMPNCGGQVVCFAGVTTSFNCVHP